MDKNDFIDLTQRALQNINRPEKISDIRYEYYKAGVRELINQINKELDTINDEGGNIPSEGYEKLFYFMNKGYLKDAFNYAKEINCIEGEYYCDPTDTLGCVMRYFDYHDHMEASEYWKSSSATC